MGYCVGGNWFEKRCVICGTLVETYTTDDYWYFIKINKNYKCDKCK